MPDFPPAADKPGNPPASPFPASTAVRPGTCPARRIRSKARQKKKLGFRRLTEGGVFTKRKSLQIRKFITAEERPELYRGVRVSTAIIVVRVPSAAPI